MRNTALVVLLLLAPAVSLHAHGGTKMDAHEVSCGQEMAADSEVPALLSKLMGHVAGNMEAHARWVGAEAGGKREHDSLVTMGHEYRAIAEAAGRAASAMRAMKDLPAAPHDPARLDRAGQARWMRAKIDMQVELARMLMRHAEASKKVLAELESR